MTKHRTANPIRYAYFDKHQNREVTFDPKPDELVVTIEPSSDTSTARTAEDSLRSAATGGSMDGVTRANYRRGIAVIRVSEDIDSVAIAGRTTPREFLNTIPAFIDSDGSTRYFVPDELTVQFNADVDDAGASAIIADLGSSIITRQRTAGYYTISVPEGNDVFSTIDRLNQLDAVRFAETSEIGFDDAQSVAPNEPRFAELWGLQNTGQTVQGTVGTPGVDINVVEAWQTTRGNRNVIIVVIDTGMDVTHVDLVDNLLERGDEDWDFAANDESPDDERSHGTHVAGTAAAAGDNQTGIIGVAPECRLMPLRVNLSSGMNANRADAINFACERAKTFPERRYVINCSWRASGRFSAILAAIDAAVDEGALVVFAAGNANRDMDARGPQYPGAHPNAICVAALDSNGQRASFSNYGSQVDVSAPGVNTLSTIPSSRYDFSNGTSMAAPHVSGTLALIWSANMSLRNIDARAILEDTCDEISGTDKLGRGRVNAGKAVTAATSRDV